MVMACDKVFYYNSLTAQWSAWNKPRGDKFPDEAGFIARFQMIK